MKKVASILLLSVATTQLFAVDSNNISGTVKYRQMFDANKNGFEPNTGSAIGLNLNYKTSQYKGFQGHIGFFYNGAIEQFMDRDGSKETGNTTTKIASGYFTDSENESRTILSRAYLSYKGDKYLVKVGRRDYNQKSSFEKQNPMARLKISMIPNLVESYGVEYNGVKGYTFGFEHITKLALGSRSMPDFGLIGEKTGTAGAIVNPMKNKGNFTNIGELAGVDDTAGITVLSALTKVDNLKLQAWNYYGHEISNILYTQADYSHKMSGVALTYSAQWLNQTGIGDSENTELSSNLFGLKVLGKYKGFVPSLSFNQSTGDKFFNYLAIDPAFTSSIYSRNAYREDVLAFKLMLAYKVNKQWKAMVANSNYSKSKTKMSGKISPLTDATETDIVVSYKPQKNLVIKLLKVFRTSEYDGAVIGGAKKDRTMDTTRLAINYKF